MRRLRGRRNPSRSIRRPMMNRRPPLSLGGRAPREEGSSSRQTRPPSRHASVAPERHRGASTATSTRPRTSATGPVTPVLVQLGERLRRQRCVALAVAVVLLAGCGLAQGSPTKPAQTATTTTSTAAPASNAIDGIIGCGSQFFTASDESFLNQSYGSGGGTAGQICVLSVDASTWFDLISPDSWTNSAGGDVVLVETCAAADATCLDPSAPHPLSDFTAYPAPDGQAVHMKFFSLLWDKSTGSPAQDGTLAIIQDGACGIDIFDLATDDWYTDATASADQLLQGNASAAVGLPAASSFPASQSPPSPAPAPSVCDLAGP